MIQDGGTALIFASRASHIAIVEYLVQHGADIRIYDNVRNVSFILLSIPVCDTLT